MNTDSTRRPGRHRRGARRRALFPLLFAALAAGFGAGSGAGLTAQDNPPVTPGKIGFSVAGAQGAAGVMCSGFQCQPLALGLTRGEKLTLSIRTQLQSPWILLIGPPTPVCLPFAGIGNMWAGPGIIVAAGVVTGPDLIRCWGGLQTIPVTVPQNLPLQTSALLQVVAEVVLTPTSPAKGPVFTAPVLVTVTQ